MTISLEPRPSVHALGYLGIGVSDIPAWRKFTALLGLMDGGEGPDGSVRYRSDDQLWRLALYPDAADDCLFAGFDCGTQSNFERLIANAAEAGYSVALDDALARSRTVMALARITDPNGMPIELFYGPRVAPEHPFRSPQALAGFMTGGNGLGHIVVNAADVEASTAFYTNVLGLHLSDRILFEPAPGVTIPLIFLHCNERHHTIAIAPRMPGSKRIHHLMLEVPGIDDVGSALDRMMSAGVEISATLGRHSNDRMISFYVRTPSGFEVEYGCAGIAIDRAHWAVVDHASISVWGHRRERI